MSSNFSAFSPRSLRRFYKKNKIFKIRKKKKFFRKLLRKQNLFFSKRFFKNKRLRFARKYLYVRYKLQAPALLKSDLIRKRKIKFLMLKSRNLKKKRDFLRRFYNTEKANFLNKFKSLRNFLKIRKRFKFSFVFKRCQIKSFWVNRKRLFIKRHYPFKTKKNISLKYFFLFNSVSKIKSRYFFFFLFNLRKNILNSFMLDIY